MQSTSMIVSGILTTPYRRYCMQQFSLKSLLSQTFKAPIWEALYPNFIILCVSQVASLYYPMNGFN